MVRRVVFVTALVLALISGFALAQQEKPAMDPAMQQWLEMAAPGAPHAALAKLSGKWKTAQKTWMDPAQPPMESTGSAEFSMMHGGRFLQQKYAGTMMDMPFEGFGLIGFDNFGKRYMGTWCDNMGTMFVWATGSANAAGNEITLEGSMDDPMQGGKPKKFRQVMKMQNPDRYVFELWEEHEGKFGRTLEVVHTRVK